MNRKLKKGLAVILSILLCAGTINMEAFADEIQSQESDADEAVLEENGTDNLQSEEDSANEAQTEESTDVMQSEESKTDPSDTEKESATETEISNEADTDSQSTESVYQADGFQVTFTLTEQWNGGYNANVKIENTGNTVIENWYLGFEYADKIANIWNAEIHNAESGKYIIKNAGWNADISVGGCVEFGFGANEDFSGFPKTYELLGENTETDASDYTVNYHVDSDWKSGFTATISVTNNTESALEDWVLEFDYTSEITNIWNAVVYEHEDGHYIIKNAGYNANIFPNQTISFGFMGEYENVLEDPSNYRLYTYNLLTESDNKTDNEEEHRLLTWDEMQDTDGDGLPDSYETIIGTNPNCADTDGDGLTDGYEVLYSSTDPCDKYTMKNGVADGDLDPDTDGLTILQEQAYGTDPLYADTDYDGLTDGEEVSRYGTDPLKYDTDDDGIGDGDEIALGLDPRNPATFGCPDSEYRTVRVVSPEDVLLQDINGDNQDYCMMFEAEGCGNPLEGLIVRESAYSAVIDNDSILGVLPEFLYEQGKNAGKLEKMKLSFEINPSVVPAEYSSIDFSGINRYNIFWYNTEVNMLLPLETTVDETSNTVSAEVTEIGTYCVMDMEKWLIDLGFTPTDGIQTLSLMEEEDYAVADAMPKSSDTMVAASGSESLENDFEISEEENGIMLYYYFDVNMNHKAESKDKIDMVFCFNNGVEGLTDTQFESIRTNIEGIGRTLFYQSQDVRVFVVDQNGNPIKTPSGKNYAGNTIQFISMIEQLTNEKTSEVSPINVQVNTMLNIISLRDDAFKTAIFIGNAGCHDLYSGISEVVAANIYCCAVHPMIGSGSWYAQLTHFTDGLIISNYNTFSEDVLTYIYGYIPEVPFSYKMISSLGLKPIYLDSELKVNGTADTDLDRLTDWTEVNQKYVTANEDGSVTLPLFVDFCSQLMDNGEWSSSFLEVTDSVTGKTFEEMLREIYVLPVVSDPTKRDGDSDGIPDAKEIKWDGMDERYKDIGPLHKDTIETLFPEIKTSSYNDPEYPTYLTVEDNDVVLHVKVAVEEHANEDAMSALRTSDLSANEQTELNNITNRKGNSITFKELAFDGIKNRWEGSYQGNEYDFFNRLTVNFSIDITEVTEFKWLNRIVDLTFLDGICGVSNQSGVNWKASCNRYVTMYSSYCKDNAHENQFSTGCAVYQENQYSPVQYQGTVAHEFGHVFGLQDMYRGATINYGYEPVANTELVYDPAKDLFALPQAKGIMACNGSACANDIEMIMLAFSENTWQYYVPYGSTQVISKAIKKVVKYKNIDLDASYQYVWNNEKKIFE